jgi:phosphonate transport system permease protein
VTRRGVNRGPTIPLRKATAARVWLASVLVVLVAVTIYGLATVDTKGVDLVKATAETGRYFGLMALQPRAVGSHFGVPEGGWGAIALVAGEAVLITLALGFLSTLIGFPLAIVLGLLASRNLSNPLLSNAIITTMAVIRAVPTVLWVLVFAIGAGLGSVAAVVGMSFHTVAQLAKSFSESFEEIDPGLLDALRAAGADAPTVVMQGVLPATATSILSWTFIRFEINFGVAVAMGAAAGAGGIGFNLFMSAGYFFDIREVGFITYLILAVALGMEGFVTRLNRRLAVIT